MKIPAFSARSDAFRKNEDARFAIYLPGNGGLLIAVASRCISDQFPDNGKWKVKWENLNEYVK